MAEEGYLSAQLGALRLSAWALALHLRVSLTIRAAFVPISSYYQQRDDGAARKSICESYKSVELAS